MVEKLKKGIVLYLILGVAAIVVLIFYWTRPVEAPGARESMSTAEFSGVSLRIDYAMTAVARERGLGGRESVPNDYGMLFIFAKDDYYGFWMKDMLVPVDIFWLDSDGHVVSIIQDVATSTYPHVFYPDTPARYVLETVAGFGKAHDIKRGTPFLLKNPPGVSK